MSQHERKISTIDEKKDYIREASEYLDSYAKVVIKRQVQIDERADNGEFGKWLKKGFEKENPNYTIDVNYTNEDKVMNVASKNLEAKLSISVNNGVKYNDEPIEDVLSKINDDNTLGKISKLQKVAKNYMTEASHQISVRHDELRNYVKNFQI